MPSLAYNLGRIASRYARRVKWIAAELAGTEAERIRTEELGRELAARFDPAVEADPDCPAPLAALGGRLASHVGKPRRRFRFQLLREKANNAWAVPGGYVYRPKPWSSSVRGMKMSWPSFWPMKWGTSFSGTRSNDTRRRPCSAGSGEPN